ncbi:MAG: discoidin domain-containing protein [Clostridia bacterium]|nr:discoidin domain-containing protein [Clostridia bacterium]
MKRLLASFLSGLLLGSVLAIPVAGSTAKATENAAPTVLPAIRQWTGGNGKFIPKGGVTLANPDSSPAVEKVQGYFAEMLSMEAVVTLEDEGDVIFLKDDTLLETVGEEGYTLEATEDKVVIKAATDTGLLYGGITVCQSLYADGFFPVGSALDYPSYPIRSGMIDVGRAWIPLEYVEEISRYMVWFKMNEIHLHINDEGSNGYSAFRLESDVAGLTAKDGYYTKDDYRAYQKRMLEYGMTVVTEIDTPFHSRCYQSADNPPPHLPGNDRCLDISKPETLEFVKNLLAEYMTGDDPVFVGKVVHIGTDEYPREYAEDMRAYTDALIKYVDSLGYIPRHWGSMGPEGFPGETPVAEIGQVNFWDWNISGASQTMASNYDVINTVNSILYTVPTTNYGFPDYFNLQYMYQNWQVNVFNYYNDAKVDPNDPQLKGACFALWNDLHTSYKGVTRYDIFDRLRGMVCMVAEKTWLGVETKNRSAEEFVARYETLSLLAGDADPGRHTYPEEGIELTYADGLALNGNADLSFDIPALGFPNTLEFEISLDEIPTSPLFAGDGVEIWADADGKGHFGFKNEVYTFTYDYTLPVGEKVKLRLSCDGKSTILTVNDTLCFDPVNGLNLNDTKLSTLIIPLEQVLQGVKGTLYSLRVTPAYESVAHLVAGRNLALNAPVSVSKLEVEDGRFTADLAVDGTEDTRLSFSAKEDEQWLLVDLGGVCEITRIEICYNERVSEYDIQVSEDGETFTTVYTLTGGEERKQETDVILLETPAVGRYVRYRQHKRWYHAEWNTFYSGGIREFRVFSVGLTAYEERIAEAYKMLEELPGTDPRRSDIRKAVNALKTYITSGNTVYVGNAELLSEAVLEAMNAELPEEDPEDVSDTESLAESTPEASAPAPAKKGFPWWIPTVGAAVLGAAAAVILLLRKKKS